MIRLGRFFLGAAVRCSGAFELQGKPLKRSRCPAVVRCQERSFRDVMGPLCLFRSGAPRGDGCHALSSDLKTLLGEFDANSIVIPSEDLFENAGTGEPLETCFPEPMDGVGMIGKRNSRPARLIAATDTDPTMTFLAFFFLWQDDLLLKSGCPRIRTNHSNIFCPSCQKKEGMIHSIGNYFFVAYFGATSFDEVREYG